MNSRLQRLGLPALLLAAAALATSAFSQNQTPARDGLPYTTEAHPDILHLPIPTNSPKTMEELKAIQARVEAVVKNVLPAVVALRINDRASGESEEGSGVIVSSDGYVLTAGHVSGAPKRPVTVFLSNGTSVSGLAMGANTQIDSGMVKITTPANYPFVPLGSSSSLVPGQWVLALGHPAGYQPERPPVLRIGRVLKIAKDRSRGFADYIQTDCQLIMGDSGGPVFDLDGRLVAINSRIGLQADSNVHVPIDTFTETWDRLAKGEQWSGSAGFFFFGGDNGSRTPTPAPMTQSVASIGTQIPEEVANGLRLPSVKAGRAAENAGLQEGDVITRMDGRIIKTVQQLTDFLTRHKPGEVVTVDYLRNDKTAQTKITLDGLPVATASGRSSQRVQPEDTKSSQRVEAAFAPVIPSASKSTVRVYVEDRSGNRHPVALGTIVSSDGYIVTKRSEVLAWPRILVPIAGMRDLREAKVVGKSEPLDLALLKVEASGLTPVSFADTRPPAESLSTTTAAPAGPPNGGGGGGRGGRGRGGGAGAGRGPVVVPSMGEPLVPPQGAVPIVVGEWVATPDAGATMGKDIPPKYVGVISVTRRTIAGPDRERFNQLGMPQLGYPFLGINYGNTEEPLDSTSVPVAEPVKDSGAAAAGVRSGDIITALDGIPVHRRADITNILSGCNVGDPIALSVMRGKDKLTLRVILGPRPELPPEDPDFQLLSGHVSSRSRDFPAVFQHDTLLDPGDCGGPLLDIEGRVIGINIARAGRTEAYALPADVVVPAIEAMKVNRLAHLMNESSESAQR